MTLKFAIVVREGFLFDSEAIYMLEFGGMKVSAMLTWWSKRVFSNDMDKWLGALIVIHQFLCKQRPLGCRWVAQLLLYSPSNKLFTKILFHTITKVQTSASVLQLL